MHPPMFDVSLGCVGLLDCISSSDDGFRGGIFDRLVVVKRGTRGLWSVSKVN